MWASSTCTQLGSIRSLLVGFRSAIQVDDKFAVLSASSTVHSPVHAARRFPALISEPQLQLAARKESGCEGRKVLCVSKVAQLLAFVTDDLYGCRG